jgi:hypothetical protein
MMPLSHLPPYLCITRTSISSSHTPDLLSHSYSLYHTPVSIASFRSGSNICIGPGIIRLCSSMPAWSHHCPVLRLKLNRSRMCLRGWSRIRETRSHPPMTWELTVMFAMTMASWGYHSEAVATLVAFDCLLRVGEVTRMVATDVIMPMIRESVTLIQRWPSDSRGRRPD